MAGTKQLLWIGIEDIDSQCIGIIFAQYFEEALADAALQLDHCAKLVRLAFDWNTPSLDFYRSIGAEVVEGLKTLCLDVTLNNKDVIQRDNDNKEKVFPLDFCQSAKDLDLNNVIPTLPRFLPEVFFFSASFIFCHCSLDIPLINAIQSWEEFWLTNNEFDGAYVSWGHLQWNVLHSNGVRTTILHI